MKIDIHAHLMPQTWPSLKDKYGYGGFIALDHHVPDAARMMRDDGVFFREVQRNCWDAEWVLRDMDEHHVDVSVLYTVPVLFSYFAQPAHGHEWSRFLNDHLADVVARHPKRFVAMGTVPMQDVDRAIEEMTRCVQELGMPGLQIGSNINGMNLDDPALFPFYAEAERLGCRLVIHPWEMLGGDRLTKYFSPWLVGMPAETTLALTSMIFGGVFDRFPKLRVLFTHAGGSFLFTLGRISHGWHARPDLCNVHGISDPRTYTNRFWVDGITHDLRALQYVLDVMGDTRVCYGTDYPFPLGDLEHGRFIEESSLDKATIDRLLCDNALEFLGMDKQRFL
ncbi:MAG: amidohydrolase family protein [Candidatus Kapaibacterium sp.]|jgi:aminocarboxymuconate-semialdehyde decarboxylase